MDNVTFQKRLYEEYGGEIIPIERFSNHKSTIQFHCGKCNTVFFNRPDYLLGSNQSRHLCGQSYRSTGGTRHKTITGIKPEKIKLKLTKKQQQEIRTRLEKGVSILYIALQLRLNVSTVRFFIENEMVKELEVIKG